MAEELNGRGLARQNRPACLPCRASWTSCKTWWTATTQEFGKIDILVNNAATNIAQGPAIEMDDTQFDKMVEMNLKSAYRLIRWLRRECATAAAGSIINIASIAGLRPQFHGLLYSMTKAALIMMTQSYALELGPQGRAGERHRPRA